MKEAIKLFVQLLCPLYAFLVECKFHESKHLLTTVVTPTPSRNGLVEDSVCGFLKIHECLNGCERVNVPHSQSWTLRVRARERLARVPGDGEAGVLSESEAPSSVSPAQSHLPRDLREEAARTPSRESGPAPGPAGVGHCGKCGPQDPGFGTGPGYPARSFGRHGWRVATTCPRWSPSHRPVPGADLDCALSSCAALLLFPSGRWGSFPRSKVNTPAGEVTFAQPQPPEQRWDANLACCPFLACVGSRVPDAPQAGKFSRANSPWRTRRRIV